MQNIPRSGHPLKFTLRPNCVKRRVITKRTRASSQTLGLHLKSGTNCLLTGEIFLHIPNKLNKAICVSNIFETIINAYSNTQPLTFEFFVFFYSPVLISVENVSVFSTRCHKYCICMVWTDENDFHNSKRKNKKNIQTKYWIHYNLLYPRELGWSNLFTKNFAQKTIWINIGDNFW